MSRFGKYMLVALCLGVLGATVLSSCQVKGCEGESNAAWCSAHGRSCGSANGADQCGVQRAFECGSCGTNATCAIMTTGGEETAVCACPEGYLMSGSDCVAPILDAGTTDSGAMDSGLPDSGVADAGVDAGAVDSGRTANLNNGAYTAAEVWDCSRSPTFPDAGMSFTVSNFGTPFADATSAHVTIGPDQTVRFNYVGGACSDPPNMTETLNNSDGGVAQTLSTSGAIWGLGPEGFIYISTAHSYGTFVSNGASLVAGGMLTYTPTTAQASCADLAAYQAAH